MKTLATTLYCISLALSVTACNTWSGVKQDAKEIGQAAGKGVEKAGEKIQQVTK